METKSERLITLSAHKHLLCGIIESSLDEEGLKEAVEGLYVTVETGIRTEKKIQIDIIEKLINYTYYILSELSIKDMGSHCTVVRMASIYLAGLAKVEELINYKRRKFIDKEECIKDVIYEECPHCEMEVQLKRKLEKQICPNCSNDILPCSLCYTDITNCNECKLN